MTIGMQSWAAVRVTDDGMEYIDTSTISGLPDICRQRAAETDAKIPTWAQGNPVICVAPIQINATIPDNIRRTR